jgi:hypothetical protein
MSACAVRGGEWEEGRIPFAAAQPPAAAAKLRGGNQSCVLLCSGACKSGCQMLMNIANASFDGTRTGQGCRMQEPCTYGVRSLPGHLA